METTPTPISLAKCFDVHDKDVTPAIYTLLFCDAFVEIQGNDMWYEIHPFDDDTGWNDGWESYDNGTHVINGETYYYSSEKKFNDRVKKGWHNCYYNKDAMKAFCENPCTCGEAINEFKQWLIAKGVKHTDILFVKIWW